MIKVPHLEELTAVKVMEQVVYDDLFCLYLPDLKNLKRPLNREYLFNVNDDYLYLTTDCQHIEARFL
jgi:hypothetical protein